MNVSKAAIKIVNLGTGAMQSYRHQVSGALAVEVLAMRRNMKRATHLAGPACLTTALAWLFGPYADPGFKCSVEQIDIWIQLWITLDPRVKRKTRHTWRLAQSNLLQHGVIAKHEGPVEGTVQVLSTLGWKPSWPDYWGSVKAGMPVSSGRAR